MARRGLDNDTVDKAESVFESAMRRLGRGSMLLVGVIGLFVVVAAVLLFWQQTLIRGQLDAMKAVSTQTDQSLVAANRMAEAAKKSADAVVDMERAYLLIDSATSVLPKSIGAGNAARIAFKNFGKTPATLRAVTGRYGYAAGPATRLAPPQTNLPVPMVIGEGAAAGAYDLAFDATDAELDKAKKGDGTMVVQALAVYADMFGEQHETAVCFEYQFKSSAFVPCATVGLDYHT